MFSLFSKIHHLASLIYHNCSLQEYSIFLLAWVFRKWKWKVFWGSKRTLAHSLSINSPFYSCRGVFEDTPVTPQFLALEAPPIDSKHFPYCIFHILPLATCSSNYPYCSRGNSYFFSTDKVWPDLHHLALVISIDHIQRFSPHLLLLA